MDFQQKIAHHIEGTKKGWSLVFNPEIVLIANQEIHNEFLDAIEEVLNQALNIACGDPDLMYEGEQRLFEVYKSWDFHHRGHRKTSTELVDSNKDDTHPQPVRLDERSRN